MLTHLHDLFYSAPWCRAVTKPTLAEAMADLLGTPNVEMNHTTLHLKPPETGIAFPLRARQPPERPPEHIEQVGGKEVSPHLPTNAWPLDDTEPVSAQAGDAVAFSIYTVHGSAIATRPTGSWPASSSAVLG